MPLVISDLSKNYGRFPALKSVSLMAEDGEFLALLGPSGSGKTTLLRVIAGLETADAGSVSFQERDLLAQPVRERGIGLVFQHYALFRHMNVERNIAFGMRAKPRGKRLSTAAIKARVDELLAFVQLEGLAKRYPSQLSGGQRQRVALARALAIDPRLLLLDEPFGALDAKVRRELRRWLRALHEKAGLTTIFVTHDQEEALELADRVVLLRDGLIEQVGTPEELYHEPASAFVFDFLGDSIKLPCRVEKRIAIIGDIGAPITGDLPEGAVTATAYVRPDGFKVLQADEPGLKARVRNVLLAAPDARLDCVLDNGEAIEVRLSHEAAAKLSPRDRVALAPITVRVWRT